jgi:hypothetical protein
VRIPEFTAERSLHRPSQRYLASETSLVPDGIVMPQFNYWCYVKCIQWGGDPYDCSLLCSGLPRRQ